MPFHLLPELQVILWITLSGRPVAWPQRILRQKMLYVGQHQFLMLLFVIKAQNCQGMKHFLRHWEANVEAGADAHPHSGNNPELLIVKAV